MSNTSPYRRQLKAYEESWKSEHESEAWKTDHEEVKRRLWCFEDKLKLGLALFQAIHAGYWNWRCRISDRKQKFQPEDNVCWREVWEWWLRPCDSVISQLEELEKEYGRGSVEEGAEFRRNCEEARELLRSWGIPDGSEVRATAHTDRVLTNAQTIEELNRVSHPVRDESVPLKHKIDRTKVF